MPPLLYCREASKDRRLRLLPPPKTPVTTTLVLLLLLLCVVAKTVCGGRVGFLPFSRHDNAEGNKCLVAHWWLPHELVPMAETCPTTVLRMKNVIYVFYDINHSEGFNLRRDVYIRLAVFMRDLYRRGGLFANVRLVLPPWPRLYHWNTHGLKQASQMWRAFFDLESMRRHAPILDYDEFLEEYSYLGQPEAPYVRIDQVYRLMHFDDMLESGIFHDKYELVRGHCSEGFNHGGQLLRQPLLRYTRYHCMRFQGSASLLERVLRQTLREQREADDGDLSDGHDAKIFAILGAETVLHDYWGDANFWRARRSMRFSHRLSAIADDFRRQQLQTDDDETAVQRPAMWELERPYREARGGNYLCAHLRRGDFIQGRQRTTPTLKSAALQMKQRMRELNVTTVFVATDATPFELMELKEQFYRYRFVHFTPESQRQREAIKDGGIAIIDQLVCAYARHFIGTYESTFTYRIYEEREILGFTKRKTFNTFCKYPGGEDCVRNSVWPIMY